MTVPRVSRAQLEIACKVIDGLADVPDDPDTSALVIIMREATLDLRDARADSLALRDAARQVLEQAEIAGFSGWALDNLRAVLAKNGGES